MPTRIKRYEERLDRLDQLLGRIEEEMGPQAQLETREFRRGGFLGMIGGLRMIEVVATTEVELNLQPVDVAPEEPQSEDTFSQEPQPPANSALLKNGATASVPTPAPEPTAAATPAPEPVITPTEPATPPEPAMPVEPAPVVDLAEKVGEGLAAISRAVENGQRTIDIQADEPLDLSLLAESEAPELPTAPPQQPAAVPGEVASLPPAVAQTPFAEIQLDTEPDLAPGKPEVAVPPAVEGKQPASSDELAEIKSTISELSQTISLLVAQSQASQTHPAAGANPVADNAGSLAASPIVNPVSIDPGTMFSGVQRNVFDRLLDWNIGPYDAIDLINTVLSTHDDPLQLTEDSLTQMVTRDICRNVLLSGGIELRPGPPGKVVALIGATGIGKTTTIAKLAAHFAFQGGKRVSLVSLDNYRIAAAEQLRTYTDIMGIDLDIVFSKEEFDQVLTQRAHNDLVLIDTAGRSPLNTKQIFELRDIFSTHPPDEVHLVVSASTKGDDLRTILENFEPLSYDHVIVSKLDETRSLGCVYNINKMCQMPISYFTVGQSVPEDIRTATLSFIQAWIDQGRII